MILPMSASLLAEIVPTWAISLFEATFLEFFEVGDDGFHRLVDTALEFHRIRAGGDVFGAFAIDGCGETVAVVVPSPATSLVLLATSAPSGRPCSRTGLQARFPWRR